MTVPDWHAHAQQVVPLSPLGEPPVLSLVSYLVEAPAARQPADLPESADVALGARLGGELAALTRVLLGVGAVHAPSEPEAPDPAPPEPEPDVVTFVAPPVVEVAPLVDVPPPLAVPPPRRTILEELAFLDS